VTFFEGTPEGPGTRQGDQRRRRRMWLVLGGFVLLAAAAYVALHQLAAGRVPLGTQVAGIRIGGLDAADAEVRLRETFGGDLTRPVEFVHDDRSYPFVPSEAGVDVDWAASVRATGVHEARWTPASLWTYFTGGRSREPVLDIDAQRFTDALDDLTAKVGRPQVEGTVEFRDGRPVPVYGRAGLVVDHDRARALVAALLVDPQPTELPVRVRRPYISDEAVDAALRDFARPAMSADVTLVIGGRKVVAPPRLVGRALSMVPDQGRLVPLVNGRALVAALRPVMRTIGDKPQDATVRIVDGKPVVVPAVYGAAYDVDDLARRLPAVLVAPVGRRTLAVHAAITPPTRTTAQVRALGVTKRIGSYTVTGGTALAGGLDGALLLPGEALALAERVGAPSRPLGTALFVAALRAGLTVTSHTPSPAHDPAMPAGREMTDVEITAGRHGVLVTAVPEPGSADRVTVSVWSTREFRVRVRVGPATALTPAPVREDTSTGCVARTGADGFDITVLRTRTPLRGGTPVTDSFRTHYLPVDAVRCVPAPPPTTSTTPGAAASG
jgi:vancomycin resistance protein YoaR